jgi:hypothetical protein
MLKFPEKSFSTATPDYNNYQSALASFRQDGDVELKNGPLIR